MDTRIQHENEPSQGPSAIFWHAKDCATAHEVAAGAWETPPAVIRWLKMPSRMARWFYDQSRIWTFPLSCVHLVSISGVWRQHNENISTPCRKIVVIFNDSWKTTRKSYVDPLMLRFKRMFHLIFQNVRDRPFNLQGGGGGLWFFGSFRKKNSDNTRVRIFIFFVAQSAKFFSKFQH
jgi:hypothetical protein